MFFYKENVIKHIEAQVNRKAKNTFNNQLPTGI